MQSDFGAGPTFGSPRDPLKTPSERTVLKPVKLESLEVGHRQHGGCVKLAL